MFWCHVLDVSPQILAPLLKNRMVIRDRFEEFEDSDLEVGPRKQTLLEQFPKKRPSRFSLESVGWFGCAVGFGIISREGRGLGGGRLRRIAGRRFWIYLLAIRSRRVTGI